MDASREAWLASVLSFEQLEAGLRPFVKHVIEGPFAVQAAALAKAELGPLPWFWGTPYPSATKSAPSSYWTWMKNNPVASAWFRVLFGGDGSVATSGLHRRSPPQTAKGASAYPWHNSDEQKFADIVSTDESERKAAAWELAKMLVGSLDSTRATAVAKTGVEGFAVDGLLHLMRFCKAFEQAVPPLQAPGVLDDGGPVSEAGRVRNHTFHPSGATAFQLTQAQKEDMIGRLEAVLSLVYGWEDLPDHCKEAILDAQQRMAEQKAPNYVIGDLRRVYEMYVSTAAQLVELKAEAEGTREKVVSLAQGVQMLCAALPDYWQAIAEAPLRRLGLANLPQQLDQLQTELQTAIDWRLQRMQEQLSRVEQQGAEILQRRDSIQANNVITNMNGNIGEGAVVAKTVVCKLSCVVS